MDDVKVKFNGLVSRVKKENWLQVAKGGMAASTFFQHRCNYLTITHRKEQLHLSVLKLVNVAKELPLTGYIK